MSVFHPPRRGADTRAALTYPKALLFAVIFGLCSSVSTAAGKHESAWSAIPYGVGTAAFLALIGCAAVAYKNR